MCLCTVISWFKLLYCDSIVFVAKKYINNYRFELSLPKRMYNFCVSLQKSTHRTKFSLSLQKSTLIYIFGLALPKYYICIRPFKLQYHANLIVTVISSMPIASVYFVALKIIKYGFNNSTFGNVLISCKRRKRKTRL